MVKLLVELGADPDMVSMEQTPLLAAAQIHHFQGKAEYLDVISFLLQSGADPLKATQSNDASRSKWQTPLDFAVQSMDSKVSRCMTSAA
jgi:hypothetical protein